jgi:retron-type reverse transcriptase
MECPICNSELKCVDYYGKTKYAEHYYIYPQSWIEKEGDIFICENCEEETGERTHFYTTKDGEIHEGYPC